MRVVADIFIPLVLLAAVALTILAVRLDRRVGRGSLNAGPASREAAIPADLRRTPWELASLEAKLHLGGPSEPDLIDKVNRLIDATDTGAGGVGQIQHVGMRAGRSEIGRVVDDLEHRLELGPLGSDRL